MQEPIHRKIRRPAFAWLLCGFALVTLAYPVYQQLGDAYAHSRAGAKVARYAQMAETTVHFGFTTTRFMPVGSPHPSASSAAELPYAFEQPVLDHLLRSVARRQFGEGEKVMRGPSFVAWLIAGLLVFLLLARQTGVAGSVTGLCAWLSLPAAGIMVLSSVQSATAMAAALSGIWFYCRFRNNPGRMNYGLMLASFFASMQCAWAGYAAPLLLAAAAGLGLAQLASDRKRVWVGLLSTMASAFVVTWLHADVFSGTSGQFFLALKGLGDFPFAELDRATGPRTLFWSLMALFGRASLALIFACLLQVLVGSDAKPWRKPWFFCLVWGLVGFTLSPASTSVTDLRAIYWLPLVAATFALSAEIIAKTLQPHLKFNAGILVAIIAMGAFGWFAWSRPLPAPAVAAGENHRKLAESLRRWIEPQDRRLIVTNYSGYDADILGSYLGADLVTAPTLTAADLDSKLRPRLQREFAFLKGQRALFIVAPLTDSSPDAQRRDAALRIQLLRIGSPYKGYIETIDISTWLWKR
ncbi:MAG: hypothetical protein V3W41_01095 [Planctomycetota bacterium]